MHILMGIIVTIWASIGFLGGIGFLLLFINGSVNGIQVDRRLSLVFMVIFASLYILAQGVVY